MAGFNHVVSQKRFVGYFLAAPDLCGVTVFEAIANDEALVVLPRRLDIDTKAADRAELDAGEGPALSIACTTDADAIKIAAQLPAAVDASLDAGIELMAIAGWRPFKTRPRVADFVPETI